LRRFRHFPVAGYFVPCAGYFGRGLMRKPYITLAGKALKKQVLHESPQRTSSPGIPNVQEDNIYDTFRLRTLGCVIKFLPVSAGSRFF
jgi:hypothetical protein